MRALLVATLVFVAALAGCSGKKGSDDDHLHYECPDGTEIHGDDYEGVLENITVDFLKTKCPKSGTGTGTKTNTTTLGPNKLPVLVLNITDDAGNVTNVTMLDGNLTFSAKGSHDPDGQVSAIAISVTDSNTTRTKALYDGAKKVFTDATFKFDRPGVVNVTIAMVDDRAGFNNSAFPVFVNHLQLLPGGTIAVPAHQAPSQAADPCKGASGTLGNSGPLVDAQYFGTDSFQVHWGATFVEATPDPNTRITICDPAGNAISPTKQTTRIETNPDVVLTVPAATQSYQIGYYANTANTNSGATVIVHYEPRPAAAA